MNDAQYTDIFVAAADEDGDDVDYDYEDDDVYDYDDEDGGKNKPPLSLWPS